MNANGTAPNDLFSWNNNTISTRYWRYLHYFLLVMHVNTHSVHNRILKPWWGRILCVFPSHHVLSPPLSKLNWHSLTPTGGPGPPTPKMASPPTGSAHSPFSGSRTFTNPPIWWWMWFCYRHICLAQESFVYWYCQVFKFNLARIEPQTFRWVKYVTSPYKVCIL